MTKKLYYENQYLSEFQANIIETKEKDNFFHLLLDQTAFYPGGGGQPADKGNLDNIEVKEVYSEGEKIFHVVKKMPETDQVRGLIDSKFRLEMMQQHLGQHILSAVLYNKFSARTIGFHLTENSLTIDTDRNLSYEQIKKTEEMANEIIYKNLNVKNIHPEGSELKKLPLRKQPSVSENIRVIKIDDFDYSPCGGTHPESTAEVGIIKINNYENYKDGLRIYFSCGIRALRNYDKKEKTVKKAVEILSVPEEKIIERIDKLLLENIDLQKENEVIKKKFLDSLAEVLLGESEDTAGIKLISRIFSADEISSQNELSYLAAELTKRKNIVFISSLNIDGMCRLVFSRSDNLDGLDMQQILKQALDITGGGGGGSQLSAQGGGGDAARVETAFKKVKNNILKIVS
ncbi:MAG: alanyl-tRNA editing protein [Bacillota bacterium]